MEKVLSNRVISNIKDAYSAQNFSFSFTHAFVPIELVRTSVAITVVDVWHPHELINASI